MSEIVIVLGTKNWSSWSLRPWLALKHTGVKFREVVIPLRRPGTRAQILRHSPSGKVPLLKHGKIAVWDSLAICEHLAEAFPKAKLWPAERAARATARAVSAEMHSGFAALREALSMAVAERRPAPPLAPAVADDIARIEAIWRDCRKRFGKGGPFLFGRFSIADAMYAPVTTRFTTYGIAASKTSRAYIDAIAALPAMQAWTEAARREIFL